MTMNWADCFRDKKSIEIQAAEMTKIENLDLAKDFESADEPEILYSNFSFHETAWYNLDCRLPKKAKPERLPITTKQEVVVCVNEEPVDNVSRHQSTTEILKYSEVVMNRGKTVRAGELPNDSIKLPMATEKPASTASPIDSLVDKLEVCKDEICESGLEKYNFKNWEWRMPTQSFIPYQPLSGEYTMLPFSPVANLSDEELASIWEPKKEIFDHCNPIKSIQEYLVNYENYYLCKCIADARYRRAALYAKQ